mgnify:CR=1 FL=1
MRLVSREKKSPAAWIGLCAGIAHENSCSGLGALLKIPPVPWYRLNSRWPLLGTRHRKPDLIVCSQSWLGDFMGMQQYYNVAFL